MVTQPHGLMFHHFHDGQRHRPSQGSIDADDFAGIIKGYQKESNLLSAADWYAKAIDGKLSASDICITFDDNLRCQFDIALPVLESFHIKAFWFIYTQSFDNIVPKLELYRYFRHENFNEINDFYKAFIRAVEHSVFQEKCDRGLKDFDPDQYLVADTFYSKEDKKFRYIRDQILGETAYAQIMDGMIHDAQLNTQGLVNLLWMDQECLKVLKSKGHILGLHSHTHPTDLKQMSYQRQKQEYETNAQRLKGIIKDEIRAMSHPCNSYNQDTLDILNHLGIKIGFRADLLMEKFSPLEFPRLDHALVMRGSI